MEDTKLNKSLYPLENKGRGDPAPTGGVKIKFRPGRAAEGVATDENGVASVDAAKAEYLVHIGYADYVKEM